MYSESVRTLYFLGGQHQQVLPIYQRGYSWVANLECKKLLDDLIFIGNHDESDSWYLGAIVCQNKGGNLATPVFVLIDGQQRLTTVTILICAITEYLRKHPKTKLDEVKNWDSLLKSYVVNSEGEAEKWYKLLLNNQDKNDLKELIYRVSKGEDIPKYKGQSKIFTNYNWFKRNINKNNISSIYDGLRKLEMIQIILDEKDVAQNIFETLNSTGQSLQTIDQIRNYLLMGLEESEEVYNHYWRPMENSFKESILKSNPKHFDWFARYFLIATLEINVNSKDVYDKFRVASNNYEDAQNCIKELSEFSKYYLRLFGDCEEDVSLKKEVKDINIIAMRMMTPFLLKLYYLYDHIQISKEEFIALLNMIESYYMRISVSNVGKSVISANLPVNLNRLLDKEDKSFEIAKYFLNLKGEDRFIPDSTLRENVHTKNFEVYRKNHFVLSKLTNFGRIVPLDTSELEVISIFDDVSPSHSYKIGNFTLEGIDLCMDIDADTNEEFIDKRTEALIDLILKGWEYPSL